MEEEMKNNTNGIIQLIPPEPNTNIPIKYPEIAPLILTDLNLLAMLKIKIEIKIK